MTSAFVLIACSLTNACHEGTNRSSVSPASATEQTWRGKWNYVQPNEKDDTNVGHLECPDGFSLSLPQIGWMDLARTDGRLSATTDQGCTWTFALRDGRAELSPASQTCFNRVIGSSYTLTRWSVAMSDSGETESIAGKSHQPGGDCDFTLPKGRRTRVSEERDDPTLPFVGTWDYDAPASGANIELVTCPGDVPGTLRSAVASGSLIITKVAEHRIQAATSEGCSWTFSVDGNTAELSPAPQTCKTGITTAFWAMTSNGDHAAVVMSHVAPLADASCNFVLATGKLSKSSRAR